MNSASLDLLIIGHQGRLARALRAAIEAYRPDLSYLSHGRDHLDITNRADSRRAIISLKPKIVINTAALTQVDDAQNVQSQAFDVNARGAAVVAQACREAGSALIHVSTDYVFNGQAGRPYVESDMTAPLNVYGRTKCFGERLVHRFLPEATVLRTAWLFDAWDEAFFSNVLTAMHKTGRVRGAKDQLGSPTYLPGFSQALLELGSSVLDGTKLPPLLHLAGAGQASRYDVVEQMASVYREQTGARVEVEMASIHDWPNAANRPADSRLDCTLAESFTGVNHLVAWEDGVERAVRAVLSNSPNSDATPKGAK
ncbi:MAG: dTDP-4-dehydrorhamnose reductase [Pseudomonadota bacterium]